MLNRFSRWDIIISMGWILADSRGVINFVYSKKAKIKSKIVLWIIKQCNQLLSNEWITKLKR